MAIYACFVFIVLGTWFVMESIIHVADFQNFKLDSIKTTDIIRIVDFPLYKLPSSFVTFFYAFIVYKGES